METYTIALDVGGSAVKSGLVDTTPALAGPLRHTPVYNGARTEALLKLFRTIVAAHVAELNGRPLRGVGAAFPSPFDYGRGVSLMQHKYAALHGQDLAATLRAALPDPALPVVFRNDAEAAVVGEARFGAGANYRRLLGVTLGTGLGACFVADGQAVRDGATVPSGGELWEQPWQGGLADDWFSIRGLQARVQQSDLRAAAAQAASNPELGAGFAAFGGDLGRFLGPFVSQFGAEAILVQGGLANASAYFLPAMQAALAVPVLPGVLGEQAALLGAAAALDP